MLFTPSKGLINTAARSSFTSSILNSRPSAILLLARRAMSDVHTVASEVGHLHLPQCEGTAVRLTLHSRTTVRLYQGFNIGQAYHAARCVCRALPYAVLAGVPGSAPRSCRRSVKSLSASRASFKMADPIPSHDLPIGPAIRSKRCSLFRLPLTREGDHSRSSSMAPAAFVPLRRNDLPAGRDRAKLMTALFPLLFAGSLHSATHGAARGLPDHPLGQADGARAVGVNARGVRRSCSARSKGARCHRPLPRRDVHRFPY